MKNEKLVEMKAAFELEFGDAETAKKAVKVLSQKMLEGRAQLECAANKSIVRATITAEGFSLLRAISTSFLRDARVFYDSLELAEKAGRQEMKK